MVGSELSEVLELLMIITWQGKSSQREFVMDIMSASVNDVSNVKETKKGTVRIVLADDHPIVRDGLK